MAPPPIRLWRLLFRELNGVLACADWLWRLWRRSWSPSVCSSPSQVLTTPQRAAADPGYLVVHFTGEGSTNQQMHLSHSTDGLNWNDLNGGGMARLR